MPQRGFTRRSLLFSLAGACAAQSTAPTAVETTASPNEKGHLYPSVAVRYSDPATEFTILRLTDPQFTSHLPAFGNRTVTTHGFLYASDMGGSSLGLGQVFWMDLKTRSSRQLTDAANLDVDSLALQPADRGFWHFDGPSLVETNLINLKKTREIYRVRSEFEKASGVSFDEAGTHAGIVETSKADASHSALRLVNLSKGTASTLVEAAVTMTDLRIRPRHSMLLYRQAINPPDADAHSGALWTIRFNGRENRQAPLVEGTTLQAEWTSDGSSLLYLNRPSDPKKLTALRQWNPESGTDVHIADTSQFVRFQANANASVFIGASASKASSYILLLIRAGKRELTLAEHRSTDARMVAPLFSPNSQFVLFQSDRHGKPAIYWVPVEKLLSETDGS